ncbi:hypothetical protein I79_017675 [Cricetulus griseus]|uniref:Uncharacterized protein n=1 Tax=Cricetulus griseus TaxID=10029 RepID=G3I2N5_CRIGR|nr:hypothetical protein I79_017675 [Cricetulus griseus]
MVAHVCNSYAWKADCALKSSLSYIAGIKRIKQTWSDGSVGQCACAICRTNTEVET